MDKGRHAEGAQHVGAIRRRGAVSAERHVDARLLEIAHPRNAGAKFEVRQRVVTDRATAGAETFDFAIGQPDGMIEG